MANQEHLAILRQGLVRWNAWRKVNPNVQPDLRDANLRGIDLRGMELGESDFRETDLRRADFRRANLSGTDLSWTNLHEANLSGTDLSWTNLAGADLSGANLSGANLSGTFLYRANLSGADLHEAILSGTDLRETHLSGVNLRGANLSGKNLIRTDLLWTDLSGSDLRGADLSGVNLRGADLREADLRGTNLTGANLSVTRLFSIRLDGAILTNAWLWETQRAGWSIKHVICEAIYWDAERQKRTLYVPGEFERLFSETAKIVLHYADGIRLIEIATLPALIQYLESAHPGCVLRLHAVENVPSGATVTLMVDYPNSCTPAQIETLKAKLETTSWQLIELERQVIEEASKREQTECMLRMLWHTLVEHRVNKYQIAHVGNLTEISHSQMHELQINYQASDLKTMRLLVAQILDQCAQFELPAETLDDLKAELQTVQAQLTKSQPNQNILREGLSSIRAILENAAGSVAGNLVAQWLHPLVQFLD